MHLLAAAGLLQPAAAGRGDGIRVAAARARPGARARLARLRQGLVALDLDPSAGRPDYPIQDAYHPPAPPAGAAHAVASADTSPPTAPAGLVVVLESIHAVSAHWSPSIDPESAIAYYAYAIGSQPGEADIRWWQSVGTATSIDPASIVELGIAEGSAFHVSVYAVNGAGLASAIVASGPASLAWEDLGRAGYELTIEFADYGYDSTGARTDIGWETEERQTLEHFTSRMNPIIEEIYGPPSHSYTVSLVKNLLYTGSNVFFPGTNEIHMAEFYAQLLTHELIHAYRDNVILSTDDSWRYHPELSGFEEGFAQGASYVCMNRYIELHPDDPVVDSSWLFGSSMDWDYDLQNSTAMTTQDFWSDGAGMGLFWARYELAAAAMRKIHLEDPAFFKRFNAGYYARLDADHALTTSRGLVADIIAAVVPEIEGLPAVEWIDRQHVFDCKIVTGSKIWVRTQHYPWEEFLIFQKIHYYETFWNGSDWAYWDDAAGEWVYHSLNGSVGTGTVSAPSGAAVWQGDLLIEPIENPPAVYRFGSDRLGFSTDSDLDPWPGGDPADYLLDMEELGLYAFDLRFDDTRARIHRVIGAELRNTTGVFGGIRNATGGHIFLDHEDFPPEPPLEVRNGAFWGTRGWASLPNPRTGGTDSQPGRVHIRYVDAAGNHYLAQRNIDRGSWNGNQVLLLDTATMTPDPQAAAAGDAAVAPARLAVHRSHPNPFNPTTRIGYRLPVAGPVRVRIYDTLGRVVRTVVDSRQEAGPHAVIWDATNDAGERMGSGAYFYEVVAGGDRAAGTMVLAR